MVHKTITKLKYPFKNAIFFPFYYLHITSIFGIVLLASVPGAVITLVITTSSN